MGMFYDFKDVEVRTEIVIEQSEIEKILDIEVEIIKQCKRDRRFNEQSEKHSEAYESLYSLTVRKTKEIDFSSELLQEYLKMRDNEKEDSEAIIRGMYSAALLEIICKANSGKSIFIDGKDKKFNYLFYRAKNASNLTIKNFKGNAIFASVGGNGQIECITLHNINGNYTFLDSGRNGKMKHIVLSNITGDYTFAYAGGDKGVIEHTILIDITGERTFTNAATRGTLKHLTLTNIKGDNTFAEGNLDGRAEYITLTDITGRHILGPVGLHGSVEHLLREEDITTKQKEIVKKINELAKSMHSLSFEEQKFEYNEIARLQKEIFAGET